MALTSILYVFQVKAGTIFDNILITDDVDYAEEFGKDTWGKTKEPEKKMKDAQDEEERAKREEEEKKQKEEDANKDDEEEDDEADEEAEDAADEEAEDAEADEPEDDDAESEPQERDEL